MLPSYFDSWFVFKRLIRELLACYMFLPTRRCRKIKARWESCEESKADRVVVVIAGGPSFTEDMAKILIKYRNSLDIMAMNFYCDNRFSDKLVPDYYVLSDPENLNITNGRLAEKNRNLLSYINSHKTKVICPFGEKWDDLYRPFLVFDDREIYIGRNISPFKPRGYPSNTAFKAVAIAIAMNYQKIFIVGLDYNYPNKLYVNKKNELYLKDEHHYGAKETYYGIHFKNVAHALNWWSFDYQLFSRVNSDNITNVTSNSMIDFYKRIDPVDFEDALVKICPGLPSANDL